MAIVGVVSSTNITLSQKRLEIQALSMAIHTCTYLGGTRVLEYRGTRVRTICMVRTLPLVRTRIPNDNWYTCTMVPYVRSTRVRACVRLAYHGTNLVRTGTRAVPWYTYVSCHGTRTPCTNGTSHMVRT